MALQNHRWVELPPEGELGHVFLLSYTVHALCITTGENRSRARHSSNLKGEPPVELSSGITRVFNYLKVLLKSAISDMCKLLFPSYVCSKQLLAIS